MEMYSGTFKFIDQYVFQSFFMYFLRTMLLLHLSAGL